MPKPSPAATEAPFDYEAAVLELRALTERLQRGEDRFEESLALFRRSTELVAACRSYLDSVQLELHQLAGDAR
jgi:exodeoxyribonuclease VII small subunit